MESLTVAERVDRARSLIANAPSSPSTTFVASADLDSGIDGFPDLRFADLDVERLASGIQYHGGVVVRDLLTAAQVDVLRAFAHGGTTRIIDSTNASDAMDRMVATLANVYRQRGVLDLIERYIGSTPIGLSNRSVVKRDEPSLGLAWHQDASFFGGPCGSLALWIALTECGRDCPSLMLVPARVDRVLDMDHTTVKPSTVIKAELPSVLGIRKPVRPLLYPGDAIVFDEMTVHCTGSGWNAPFRDVAITWFFARDRVPEMRADPIAF